MASHLTVTSSVAGTPASRSFGSATTTPAEGSDVLGIFAALLGNVGAEMIPTVAGQASVELETGNPFALGLEAPKEQQDKPDDAEAPMPIAAVLVPTVPVDPAPVVNLFEAMTRVKASLEAGNEPDPELLASVNKALSDLADVLGLDLDTLPVPQDFAALLETTADDTGLAGTLTQMLAPLARALATPQPASGADAITVEVKASSELKTLGDKLAALLAALETGEVPEEKLASIGLPPGKPVAAEIEKALARFAAAPAPVAVPAEPVLAMPALKLTEPVLAGKSAEPAESAAADRIEPSPAPSKPERPDEKSSQTKHDRPAEPLQRDKSPVTAFTTPAANEAAPADSQSAPQPQSTPRVDAAAITRVVVQPGYQTSQQQLNLPQIAFELGRQIEGGNTRFQIRLDPPELGRIDVRLEIDNAGQVNARLTVEKAETLDLMQRDQRGLERALQQAGIDAGKTNLEFSLKQNPFAGEQFSGNGRQGRFASETSGDDATEAAIEPAPTVNLYRGSLQASGVNIIA